MQLNKLLAGGDRLSDALIEVNWMPSCQIDWMLFTWDLSHLSNVTQSELGHYLCIPLCCNGSGCSKSELFFWFWAEHFQSATILNAIYDDDVTVYFRRRALFELGRTNKCSIKTACSFHSLSISKASFVIVAIFLGGCNLRIWSVVATVRIKAIVQP